MLQISFFSFLRFPSFPVVTSLSSFFPGEEEGFFPVEEGREGGRGRGKGEEEEERGRGVLGHATVHHISAAKRGGEGGGEIKREEEKEGEIEEGGGEGGTGRKVAICQPRPTNSPNY